MRGRYSWSYRHTVEQCKIIDIHWLSRHGYLCEFKEGGIEWRDSTGELTGSIGIQVSAPEANSDTGYLRFMYTMTDRMIEKKSRYDYNVDLVTTPCNFGGFRCWFICPLVVNGQLCKRRVGKLYLPPDGDSSAAGTVTI